MAECFNAKADDWWVCPCGNDPGGSGHHLAPVDGTPHPEHALWMSHQTLTCGDCGRFGRYVERDPQTGQVPVRGVVDRARLVRCQLDDDPVRAAIDTVNEAVNTVREALLTESTRIAMLPPTVTTLDVRSYRAVACESLAYRHRELVGQLTEVGQLLKALRRM